MDLLHSFRLALRFSGRTKCSIRSLGSKINIQVDFAWKALIAASTNDMAPISRNCFFLGESPLCFHCTADPFSKRMQASHSQHLSQAEFLHQEFGDFFCPAGRPHSLTTNRAPTGPFFRMG